MFCSRFVQYNQLSQDLAFDSRLVETIQQLARAANITGDAEQVTNQGAASYHLTNQRVASCHHLHQSQVTGEEDDGSLDQTIAAVREVMEETDYFR